MPQTVLGLDIGQSSIKAILLTPKGLTGGRVLAARFLDMEVCGGFDGALKTLAEDPAFAGFPCVVSLPASDLFFRQVSLPFRDDHKIRQTLPFELEPLIPLPIESVVTDYLMIAGNGLLVGAVPVTNVRDRIEKTEGGLGEVSVMDCSATALAAQVIRGKKTSGCGVILDVGRNTTTVIFYENESVIQIRSLAFGGRHLTLALAQDLSVTFDEAEILKVNDNCPETCTGTGETCRAFCADLKNTIEFMKIKGLLLQEPETITVTGGGSLFAPLRKELENCFSSPVAVLDLIRLRQLEIPENIGTAVQPQIMNTAIAAALRLSGGGKSLNFRQGEFAVKNPQLDMKKQFKRAGIVAGIILLLAVVNQIADYGLKTMQLNGIKKQISLIFGKRFPDAANINEALQIEYLKTKIAEDKKTTGFGEALPDATAADLLKDISGLISPSLDVVFTGLTYENRVISIKGEAKTMDEVTAVKNDLMKSKYFQEVTTGSTSLTKDGNKVDFSLRMDVR